MANVFGILTMIVLALAGFVAYKNKAAYETEISNTQAAKSRLASNTNRFNVAKENLATTIATDNDVKADIVKLSAEEATQKKTNADLKEQISTKTDEVNSNKEKLDSIREKTAKVGDLKELATKMGAMKAEMVQLTEDITAAEAKLANLSAQNNSTEGQINNLKGKFETISNNRSLPSLNTRIRSIYPSWGFVTLAAGNTAGVVTNSTLDVVRGDSVIAKLLVTAVERGTASASIVPDSLAADTTLMVGDRVVPSQSKDSKPAAN